MNYLYRMTHISNIPHILRYGITHRTSVNANPAYLAIGASSIIQKRNEKSVETVAEETFVPGDFIPFYFYVRMPMLYNIQHGYGVEQVSPENIVYLIVALKPITDDDKREYYFSDGHAISGMTHFYGKESIDRIDEILDKRSILNNDWGDDYEVRERKQAEFLIRGDIPFDYVTGICCYNDDAREKLLEMGVRCRIIIKPDAYY